VFDVIRRRLLLSYLLALGITLAASAVAVRFLFAYSLRQQMTEKLTALAEGALSSLEVENGKIVLNSDFPPQSLLARDQALEWFNLQGKPISHQGRYPLTLPFAGEKAVQVESGNPGIRGVTLPVVDDDTGKLVGYVRASQSLGEFNEFLNYLDWGMAGGIIIALGLSSAGGILLTRQAMQPIEHSFAQLKQFTADASHELRSPLMAIGSNAQVALRYPGGMRLSDAEKFESIADATKQLTCLTEDLLLLARTDSLPQRHQERIDLSATLTDLVQFYQAQATAQSIVLELTVPKALFVMGDRGQLRRLFTNLIDNALRYTPQGGRVHLQGKLLGSQILITVEDAGIGIAPDQIHKVFDRFWRAESARTHTIGGFGLGLSIAQAIVQQHQGRISVRSKPDVGSCFIVQLPIFPIKNKAVESQIW
jgi:OmpR-family two-component system manganese-sensing sensor histidine kinase